MSNPAGNASHVVTWRSYMLARRTTLELPLGSTIDLPKLVPSFSSKGFPFFKEKGREQPFSEVTLALEAIGPFINDSILISALDLHHGFLRRPYRFYRGKELVFIDSGGYELSLDWDSTEPIQGPYRFIQELNGGNTFSLADYRKILNKLPENLSFIITNFDWETRKKPIEDQIISAQELFNQFPKHLHNFLIKSGAKKYLDVNEIIPHIEKLRAFDSIGLTEKELGKNIIDRLKRVSKIRAAMDRENVKVPIHIWGGLDPVFTPLYFFAGAEIFDGVSWLRYAYYNGMAIYRDAYNILELGIETSLDHARGLVLNQNVTFLQQLTTSLQQFADNEGKDFDMFNRHAEVFERTYRTLCTKIPELKGCA